MNVIVNHLFRFDLKSSCVWHVFFKLNNVNFFWLHIEFLKEFLFFDVAYNTPTDSCVTYHKCILRLQNHISFLAIGNFSFLAYMLPLQTSLKWILLCLNWKWTWETHLWSKTWFLHVLQLQNNKKYSKQNCSTSYLTK